MSITKYIYLTINILICTTTSLLNATIIFPSSEQEYYQLLNKPAVIVDFYADWCGPCKQVSTALETIQQQYPSLTIVKVNTEQYVAIAQKYRIRYLPTLCFFAYGQQLSITVDQKTTPYLVGFDARQDLSAIVKNLFLLK